MLPQAWVILAVVAAGTAFFAWRDWDDVPARHRALAWGFGLLLLGVIIATGGPIPGD